MRASLCSLVSRRAGQNWPRLLMVGLFVAILLALGKPGTLHAAIATLYVSPTGSDSNPCTATRPCRTIGHALRVAPSDSTIRVAAGRYSEANLVSKSVTINGDGTSNTIIDGSGDGIATFMLPAGVNVTLSAMTIIQTNGLAIGALVVRPGARLTLRSSVLIGGSDNTGISNGGTTKVLSTTIRGNGMSGIVNSSGLLILRQSTISDNNSSGIVNDNGVLNLNASTLSSNTNLADGGGLINRHGTVVIVNSTLAENSSGRNGGGIANDGGLVTLNNATVADNVANAGLSGGSGGGIFNDNSASTWLDDTVVAGNVALTGSPPLPAFNDCAGAVFASYGFNLIYNTSGCIVNAAPGDQIGVAAKLGALQNNGGPTQTLALLPGSPAINAGDPAGCADVYGNLLRMDQRGDPRLKSGDPRCDIGAYEK